MMIRGCEASFILYDILIRMMAVRNHLSWNHMSLDACGWEALGPSLVKKVRTLVVLYRRHRGEANPSSATTH